MRNQSFDVVHGAILYGRSRQRMIRLIRSVRHTVHTLFDDAQTLPHFLYTDQRPVVAVAMGGRGNIELELLVARVGLLLAKVPFEAAGPQPRPRDAPLDRLVLGEVADSLGACLKNAIAHDLTVVFGQAGRKVADEIAEHAVPTFRQVRRDAAYAKPVGMHARPANGLNDAKRALPIVERVEYRRKLPQVLRERAIQIGRASC